jgi:hypothetical protein
MCFRCTFKAFVVILWYFKVVQMNRGGGHFNQGAQIIVVPPGVILGARSKVNAMEHYSATNRMFFFFSAKETHGFETEI